MKQIAIVALFFLIVPSLMVAGDELTGVSMLSVNSVLEKYGFQGGSVANNTAVIRSLPRPIQREFGAIEGGVAIDTPEEFLTATYFSPIEIQCAQARIRIEEVLPQDNPRVAGAKVRCYVVPKTGSVPVCRRGYPGE